MSCGVALLLYFSYDSKLLSGSQEKNGEGDEHLSRQEGLNKKQPYITNNQCSQIHPYSNQTETRQSAHQYSQSHLNKRQTAPHQ